MNNEQNVKLEETKTVTGDMLLPEGSAVLQCVIHRNPEGNGGYLDVRAITVGSDHLDPANPAHRFIQAVANRMEEIMAEVSGGMGVVEELDPAEFDARLREANAGMIAGVQAPAEA